MDVEAIEALGTRFHYAFAAAVAIGLLAVVGLAWVDAPSEVAFYSLVGAPVVLFLGSALVSVATGQSVEAAGHLVSALGWVVVLVSTGTWTPAVLTGLGVDDPLFLVGFTLTALGSIAAITADYWGRLRAVVARSG